MSDDFIPLMPLEVPRRAKRTPRSLERASTRALQALIKSVDDPSSPINGSKDVLAIYNIIRPAIEDN